VQNTQNLPSPRAERDISASEALMSQSLSRR
jgi:hypothetical protein